MLTRRLRVRTPSARVDGTGYIAGHRLTFDKVSADGSGKCDIERTGNADDRVDGVLFWVSRTEKPALDEAEGLDHGYAQDTADVVTDHGTVTAVAYFATNKDPARRPYNWYKALVIAGAVEHDLRPEYIDWLWTIESRLDPMPNRRTKREAEALLKGTGIVVR